MSTASVLRMSCLHSGMRGCYCDLSPQTERQSSSLLQPQLTGSPQNPVSSWNRTETKTCTQTLGGTEHQHCSWNTIWPWDGWERAYYLSTNTHASTTQNINSETQRWQWITVLYWCFLARVIIVIFGTFGTCLTKLFTGTWVCHSVDQHPNH